MTVNDLINALYTIREAHGNLHVLHHDDWGNFLVEEVTLEPALDGTHPIENCKQPAHVVLRGERLRFDCETGELT